MLIKISTFVVAVLAGFLTYVALKPGASTIAREIVIAAKPEALFPYINHSKKMND